MPICDSDIPVHDHFVIPNWDLRYTNPSFLYVKTPRILICALSNNQQLVGGFKHGFYFS